MFVLHCKILATVFKRNFIIELQEDEMHQVQQTNTKQQQWILKDYSY